MYSNQFLFSGTEDFDYFDSFDGFDDFNYFDSFDESCHFPRAGGNKPSTWRIAFRLWSLAAGIRSIKTDVLILRSIRVSWIRPPALELQTLWVSRLLFVVDGCRP